MLAGAFLTRDGLATNTGVRSVLVVGEVVLEDVCD
jgi:hypothetical protein